MSVSGLIRLDASTGYALEQAVAALGRHGPLPVVVVSDAYALLLDNWIAHVRALGISRFLVVAMDDSLANRLSGRGIVVARGRFDGSATDFWLRRMLIWQRLVEIGVDIVQSDIDAIWLKNPITDFFTDQPYDLLCSQGTLHPIDTATCWGFVLCTGLMGVRAGPPAVRFFNAFQERAIEILQTDDQEVMNHLFCETGLVWDTAGLAPEIFHLDEIPFHFYRSTIVGTSEQLGLRIGMLPYPLFPRLPMTGTKPYVKHLLRPEDDALRIDELKAAGCWLIDGGITP